MMLPSWNVVVVCCIAFLYFSMGKEQGFCASIVMLKLVQRKRERKGEMALTKGWHN